jgi:hypothetical protein
MEQLTRGIKHRKAICKALTLSVKAGFKGGYEGLKKQFKKVLDALYSICKTKRYVYKIWYKVVVYNGHPHVHGVLLADCVAVKKELARLWSKAGLGYGEFKSNRERGNCLFKDIYDITGWLQYLYIRKNSYGTSLKHRTSYHVVEQFKKLSVQDAYRLYHSNLSILKNLMYADISRGYR